MKGMSPLDRFVCFPGRAGEESVGWCGIPTSPQLFPSYLVQWTKEELEAGMSPRKLFVIFMSQFLGV